MSLNKYPALVVDAIVEEDGKILLVKRGKNPYKGHWALPGGFVEYGEKVEDALERELKEETDINLKNQILFNVYSEPDRDPRGHVISLCFIVKGKGEPKGGDDADEARFFSINEIPGLRLAFDHDEILKEYMVSKNVL
jgi:8-oxo-dGTP diphosphatase